MQTLQKWVATGGGTIIDRNQISAESHDPTSHFSAHGNGVRTGRHYWEFTYTKESSQTWFGIAVGPLKKIKGIIVQCALADVVECWYTCDNGYAVGSDRWMWIGGRSQTHKAGGYKPGDRIGVYLDIDSQCLRFFVNGQRVKAADMKLLEHNEDIYYPCTSFRSGVIVADWHPTFPEDVV